MVCNDYQGLEIDLDMKVSIPLTGRMVCNAMMEATLASLTSLNPLNGSYGL